MIKSLKPNANSHYSQGYYKPVNESKCKFSGQIIYRSSWERKFCMWLDHNEKVILWTSETVVVPYVHPLDKKIHRYYPDFFATMQKNDSKQNVLFEVKPKEQLPLTENMPKKPKRRTKKSVNTYNTRLETLLINKAKFEAAKEYCKARNWEFKIITEDFFKC